MRQFIRRTIQDGIRITKSETGLEDLIAIPGHFELKGGGSGRSLTWCRYGCLVFGRGEPNLNGSKVPSRLVRDPIARRMVIAIKDQTQECSACGSSPIVKQTGLCAVCTWGDDSWNT